jgi:hypothetical protein
MTRFSALCPLAAFAVVLLAGSAARADLIGWTERWAAGPSFIAADAKSRAGYLQLDASGGLPQAWFGPKRLVAATLRAFSPSDPFHPAHFTARPFSLVLFIRDWASRIPGALTFSGLLDGTASFARPDIHVRWTSPLSQRLHLGHYIYTATVNYSSPTGPPWDGAGVFTADVRVSHNPEPASVVLAALAAPALGLALWRRRRAAGAASSPA